MLYSFDDIFVKLGVSDELDEDELDSAPSFKSSSLVSDEDSDEGDRRGESSSIC